ncbi:TonB-dependent receptor plug domain-containing protein [Chitinophagaceae bacterium LB-8]|uniref:TonB-dependent receptor plug domain-containing protein n=1 Tax=Paraflavisolibacter caeni TaxID=2982496 RepID=A0A9X3B665_9BACT|nr:TonB-dependent receptor plug domain-containing protein [Paraflavisolibacter caeni]MCU7547550.1 TonB-dependent receptor plug domain-containing protein [Paraflavisolibacter caeni]
MLIRIMIAAHNLHKHKSFLFILFSAVGISANGQTADSSGKDVLQEVVIKAYEQGRRLQEVPAAVNYIGRSTLERFSPTSIVQAVNTTPGVRMEERSPGSYRFNIRGSSLRSPFGVRNVKVYYNDIPITDPGGHTYLNQLGYYNFNSIEVIKGPASSLYGAGTGGALLIESLGQSEQPSIHTEYTTGNYGLHNVYGSITTGSGENAGKASYQHQESNGYRDHSRLKRDVASWSGHYCFGDAKVLKTSFLYGNLYYETPGALTKAEYDANPKSARPGSAAFPGAEAANASIRQKTFIAGASYEQPVYQKLKNKTALYGMFTELRNPAIQNYGRNSEPHVGGRTSFIFSQPLQKGNLNIDVGSELQQGFTSVSIFKNNGGSADSLRTSDEINNRQLLVFSQVSLDYNAWTFNAGGSLNFFKIKFQRFSPATAGRQDRTFNNQFAPRLAILRKFHHLNIYTSVAKGFSPPTTSELLPTGGAVNLGLNAEEGVNYDLGIKGTIGKAVYFDVNAFIFSLENTIVQRRTAGGGDYYINAGATKQHGIETYISYPLLQSGGFMDRSLLWLSHTWHNFHYKTFKQLNNDYSGNSLPSVAPHTISTGFDFLAKKGLLGTVSYFYSDRIPLNDANTAYADAYHLLMLQLGYQRLIQQKFMMKVVAGVDNLLDQKYSLGNDINGFGGRYYNAAAGRNYFASVVLELRGKKR